MSKVYIDTSIPDEPQYRCSKCDGYSLSYFLDQDTGNYEISCNECSEPEVSELNRLFGRV